MIKRFVRRILIHFFPELGMLKNKEFDFSKIKNQLSTNSSISPKARIYSKYFIHGSQIADFSYVSQNSAIVNTTIGKFCSIGPNFLCGIGMHPIHGISTSPMFYSHENESLGFTLCEKTKFEELKSVTIGNDVFIGANVVVLNGVTIGDGAVIGAGAVVSKDIPPYAIAVGAPIKIIGYRFDDEQIADLLRLKWWDLPEEKLKMLEEHFFDVETIIARLKKNN